MNPRGTIQLVAGRIVRVPPDKAPSEVAPARAPDEPVTIRAGRPPVGLPPDAKDEPGE